MNKKIAAVAVASVFAAPAVALAQSSVTISGALKGGFENLKINNYNRAAGSGKSSQYGVVDDSSRIIFNIREDLGGGLAAIGQIDIRIKPDDIQNAGTPVSSAAGVGSSITSGNTHMGLQSKSWGRIFFGRQDLHYFNTSFRGTAKGSLRSDTTGLLSYAGAYGASGTAVTPTPIANASRSLNVVHYTTPNWGGFTGIIAYSSNIGSTDTDIGNTATQSIRRGAAWNLNPNYAAANWQVGYSYWRAKPDAMATPDQRGDRAWGYFVWGGLKLGLNYDRSKLSTAAGTTSNRTAWAPTLRYTTAPHNFYLEYAKAKDDKATAVSDGAYMIGAAYAYDLSKRTSVGISYAAVKNDVGAVYNLYGGGAGYASTGAAPVAGEDPRVWSLAIRHAF